MTHETRHLHQQTKSADERSTVQRLLAGAALAALFVALAVAANAAARHIGRVATSPDLTGSNGDYGNYAEMARVAVTGGRLYADYWTTKPPGMFFYLTPFVAAFGNTMTAINTATLVMIAAFVAVNTALAYRAGGTRIGALAALALALIYATYLNGPETTFLMATLNASAALLIVSGRGRVWAAFAAGLLHAAAFVTKQPVAVEAPILMALAYVYGSGGSERADSVKVGGRTVRVNRRGLSAAALVVVGAGVGVGAVALWALATGVAGDLWNAAFRQNAQYVLASDGAWHFRQEAWTLFERSFIRSTTFFLLPLAPTTAGALIAFALTRQTGSSGKTHTRTLPSANTLFWIVALWASLAFFGASVGRAFKAPYYFQVVPPAVLLVALGASRLWAALPALRVTRHGAAHTPAQRWGTAGAAALMALLGAWALYDFSWRHVWTFAPMTDEAPVIAAIQAHSPPDACLWTWGHVSYINYLSGRRSCASPAINAFMMDETAFPIDANRIDYLHELIRARPALHVISTEWGYFPALERYAERYLRDVLYASDAYSLYRVDRSAWHETDALFAGTLRLIGYDLSGATVCPGESLTLASTWQVDAAPLHQYQMFAQLLTPDETQRIAGYDGLPDSKRPTDAWTTPGEIVLGETFALDVPADAAPGVYRLIVGLYDVATTERAVLADGAPYARLVDVTVAACAA